MEYLTHGPRYHPHLRDPSRRLRAVARALSRDIPTDADPTTLGLACLKVITEHGFRITAIYDAVNDLRAAHDQLNLVRERLDRVVPKQREL